MSSRNASSFFQLQNQAAYAAPKLRKDRSTDSSMSDSGSDTSVRASMEHRTSRPTVEIMRCSRCAKSVETISTPRNNGIHRVSSDDALACGMVRWGHNLYYCDRCARMVGYK